MELDLVVNKVLDIVSGTTARGPWQRRDVVFDQLDDYNTKICVTFFGDKINEVAFLNPGDRVTVSFNVSSREYNGRWYTEARGWRVRPTAPAQTEAQPPMPEMPPLEQVVESSSSDDLPF